MTTKPANELGFRKSSEPIATIEIDTDSIPDIDRLQIVMKTLSSLASADLGLRATLYVHATVSFNFHEMTNSDFIGVVGPMSVLQTLESNLSRISGSRVRFSDYISTRDSVMAYHVEGGVLWCPEDALTWYAYASWPKDESAQSTITDTADFAADFPDEDGAEVPDEDDVELKGGRLESPARYRVARADASVGRIKKKIEAVFGLPEGSVALCGPDGKPLRSDARIATLRRRWES
jgi:hypothetical protein